MRLPQTLDHAQQRFRRPGTWGGVLLFGVVWNLLRWGSMPGRLAPDGFLLPFLLGAALLVLAPLPWQWTGDDRPQASFPVGLALSLLLNLGLVGLAVALLPAPFDHGPMMDRGGMMGHGMMRGIPPEGLFPLPWQARAWILGLASLCFGVIQGRIVADRDAARSRAEQAERRAREALTKALQAQMNPHVLFNAISGLAELAREDGPSAEAALIKLAELLRRLLDHAACAAAPLSKERDLVEGLLALEQFRFGDRLKVTWAWDVALEDLSAPPLLLQPLVENAIKHGIAPSRSGGALEIGLAGTAAEVQLWVANTGLPYKEGSPE
ncbi:MAG TPA: histidine kinase, partial [Holophaga sp.]|nr:histidine kinase [Holophaga sp.]